MRPFSMAAFALRTAAVFGLCLAVGMTPSPGLSAAPPAAIFGGPDGAAHVRLADGRTVIAPKERGQVDIAAGRIAADGTAGWLAEFRVQGVSYPVAQVLVLWRGGNVVRRFPTEQSYYSWSFYEDGKQIAYHTGPLHGERWAHCELHDVAGGRTIAVWDGDLDSHRIRPRWTDDLSR